jgi:hypothetical protein
MSIVLILRACKKKQSFWFHSEQSATRSLPSVNWYWGCWIYLVNITDMCLWWRSPTYDCKSASLSLCTYGLLSMRQTLSHNVEKSKQKTDVCSTTDMISRKTFYNLAKIKKRKWFYDMVQGSNWLKWLISSCRIGCRWCYPDGCTNDIRDAYACGLACWFCLTWAHTWPAGRDEMGREFL